MDGRFIRGLGLIVTVPLRNVPDIYNLTFKRRGNGRTTSSLTVQNNGYRPPDMWLTEALRTAVFDFYDVTRDRAPLSLEGGALMYTTNRRISGETFRAMIERQIAVAAEIETAL